MFSNLWTKSRTHPTFLATCNTAKITKSQVATGVTRFHVIFFATCKIQWFVASCKNRIMKQHLNAYKGLIWYIHNMPLSFLLWASNTKAWCPYNRYDHSKRTQRWNRALSDRNERDPWDRKCSILAIAAIIAIKWKHLINVNVAIKWKQSITVIAELSLR